MMQQIGTFFVVPCKNFINGLVDASSDEGLRTSDGDYGGDCHDLLPFAAFTSYQPYLGTLGLVHTYTASR